MFNNIFIQKFLGEDDLVPPGMSNDCIAQSWYRFLNTIGNPVNLTKPKVKAKAINDQFSDKCEK